MMSLEIPLLQWERGNIDVYNDTQIMRLPKSLDESGLSRLGRDYRFCFSLVAFQVTSIYKLFIYSKLMIFYHA